MEPLTPSDIISLPGASTLSTARSSTKDRAASPLFVDRRSGPVVNPRRALRTATYSRPRPRRDGCLVRHGFAHHVTSIEPLDTPALKPARPALAPPPRVVARASAPSSRAPSPPGWRSSSSRRATASESHRRGHRPAGVSPGDRLARVHHGQRIPAPGSQGALLRHGDELGYDVLELSGGTTPGAELRLLLGLPRLHRPEPDHAARCSRLRPVPAVRARRHAPVHRSSRRRLPDYSGMTRTTPATTIRSSFRRRAWVTSAPRQGIPPPGHLAADPFGFGDDRHPSSSPPAAATASGSARRGSRLPAESHPRPNGLPRRHLPHRGRTCGLRLRTCTHCSPTTRPRVTGLPGLSPPPRSPARRSRLPPHEVPVRRGRRLRALAAEVRRRRRGVRRRSRSAARELPAARGDRRHQALPGAQLVPRARRRRGPPARQGAANPDVRAFIGFIFEPSIGDRDGDGIKDDVDKCPDEPEDFDGFEDEDGCPDPDNDSDGILDVDDKCPNEPEDKDGFEDEDGCPDGDKNDRDGDGILDDVDKCPDEPEDIDGFEDEDGCPDPDNDKDGILDVDDLCPNEPEDKDGFEDEDGCPDPDNDKDGILDSDDKCPNEPETYNGFEDEDGCPDTGRVVVIDTARSRSSTRSTSRPTRRSSSRCRSRSSTRSRRR